MKSSGVLVVPNTMAPAFLRRVTKGASCFATTPARNLLPASHRMPATSIELLMLMALRVAGQAVFPG